MNPELKKAVDDLASSWASFKSDDEARHTDLMERLEKLEIKADTPEYSRKSDKREIGFKSIEKFLRSNNPAHLNTKAMSITSDADGGYTHIAELGDEIIKAVGEINPLLKEVRDIPVGANEYNQLFSTTRSGTGRAGETDTRSETGTPNLERVDATLYTLYAYPKVTEELYDSSSFDIPGFLYNDVVETFDEALGTEFLTGTGTKESLGMLTQATSTAGDADSPQRPFSNYQLIDVGTGSPLSFDYDGFVTLIHSLPVRYRKNAKLYASTDAIEKMRKLKDNQGMPIWRDAAGGVISMPQTLLGYEVVEVPQMPDVAAGAKPVMFGDLKKAYALIRHNKGLGVTRDANITTPGYYKWYIRMQCVGYPMDTRALKVMRIA